MGPDRILEEMQAPNLLPVACFPWPPLLLNVVNVGTGKCGHPFFPKGNGDSGGGRGTWPQDQVLLGPWEESNEGSEQSDLRVMGPGHSPREGAAWAAGPDRLGQ